MILDHIDAMERALARAGFPAMSDWWRSTLTGFYGSDRRQLVIRAGRRAGKSSTLARVAVLEALFGDHHVPPGDVGVVAIVSVSRDEGAQRLRTVRAILDALRVAYHPIDGGIELDGRAIAFKVFAASIAGVSGFTCIAAIADEAAKWKDSETGANPATEVLASLRPTMATQPTARLFLSSSPLGTQDAHATAFDRGDTDFQAVAYAPTWTANPSITEERTHQLEPDDRVWRREYLAEPQTGALSALDPALVDRAFRIQIPDDWTRAERVMLLDPSSGKADSFTWCSAGWRVQPGGDRRVLEIADVGGVADAVKAQATSDSLVAHVARLAKERGASTVHGDQAEQFALTSAFSRVGLRYVIHAWGQANKESAVLHLRAWLRDDRIALPSSHPKLRTQLFALTETVSANGGLTFRGRGSSHDDYALLIVLAALVDIEGGLAGTPSGPAMSGANTFEFYREEFARAHGLASAPSPLVVRPEPTVLRVPSPIPPFGTYQSRGGHIYSVVDGLITVTDAEDLTDLLSLNFKVA